MQRLKFTIGYPPYSLNNAYKAMYDRGTKRCRIYVDEKVRRFKTKARIEVRKQLQDTDYTKITGPVRVRLNIWMPDKRKRDLDNALKFVLDSITDAGVWEDDSQIHELLVYRKPVDRENPRLEITVTELPVAEEE